MAAPGTTPTKICKNCDKELPLVNFYSDPKSKDKLRYECKSCSYIWHRDYIKRNAIKVKARRRNSWFKWFYGVTSKDVDEIILLQEEKCKICSEKVKLELDHDHVTGQIRSMLCTKCNKALGLMRDDPVILRRAANYVEEHRASEYATH